MGRKKREEFNPIKEDISGKKAKRMIWSTSVLEKAITGIEEGRKLVANPFYEGNVKLLKGDMVFERTDEEISEYKKCSKDIIYFANTYAQLLTPTGIQHIKLRGYQERYLKHLVENRLSIYLAARQSAKTTSSALFLLFYILFNVDKNALILGNKLKTAREVLDKVKKIFYELPFFLKPGILKWNETEIVLDNGCRILAEATTINSGIGFTIHCCLADEFAHISPNILDAFYSNLFPVITAGRARFMITSTQNGYNLFHTLYSNACAGLSEYKAFKTDWDEVPEWDPETQQWVARDENWKMMQIGNLGSEEAFNAQFGTEFDISARTLIDKNVIKAKRKEQVVFVNREIGSIDDEHIYFHPDFDINTLKDQHIVITIDLAEGLGRDFTVFNIHRLKVDDDFRIESIGFYRNNSLSIEYVSKVLIQLCRLMDEEKLIISIEYNLYGELLLKYIRDDYTAGLSNLSTYNIVKYKKDNKLVPGIRMNAQSKQIACITFKQLYEKNIIINQNDWFLSELENFTDNKNNGTFQAANGHDDLVMTEIQLGQVWETSYFKNIKDDFLLKNKFKEKTKDTIFNIYDSF